MGFKYSKQKIKDIVDWPPFERDNYQMKGINTVVNSIYYENLQMMSLIASAIDNKKDATFYNYLVIRLKNIINEKLFDKSKGVYIDGEGSNHASLLANMFPLAFGLVPEKYKESVVSHIKTKGMACSVYGAQYLLEGLYQAGEAEYAKALITDTTYNRTWWNMIKSGSTMALEAWDIKYKPNLDWNHAWGTAPANIISRYMWGVTPKSPGFSEVAITPQLDGLNFSEITVPTVIDAIKTKFEILNTNRHVYEVELPKDMKGEFMVPKGRYKKVILNGRLMRNRKILKLNKGHNVILLDTDK